MGDRYWITGVQLAILMAFFSESNRPEFTKIIKEIEENQYIGKRKDLERMMKGK